MPKVFLSKQDKLNEKLSVWIYGQMQTKGIKQHQLAEQMGMSQQLLHYKLKHKSFSFKDFLFVVEALQPDISDIAWLVGKGV